MVAVLVERLGSQPLSGLDSGRLSSALTLGDRDHPGDRGGREQDADAAEQ